MIINESIKDLIFEYTGRYFRHENDFYRLPMINFTDTNWQRFKKGETSIEKMGAGRVSAMLDVLFEPFELALISKAQKKYYFSNKYKFSMTFPAFYDMFKKEVLLKWIDDAPGDIVGGTGRMYTSSGNMIANAYLELALESTENGTDSALLTLRFKNYSPDPKPIPSGRENRLKWVKNNQEYIR